MFSLFSNSMSVRCFTCVIMLIVSCCDLQICDLDGRNVPEGNDGKRVCNALRVYTVFHTGKLDSDRSKITMKEFVCASASSFLNRNLHCKSVSCYTRKEPVKTPHLRANYFTSSLATNFPYSCIRIKFSRLFTSSRIHVKFN